jgi:CheY-like chemotaxis protein
MNFEVKKVNVLLVDDDDLLIDVISTAFLFKGHNTILAASGNEAIQILSKQTFDVIVSDFEMKNGNGNLVLEFVNSMIRAPLFFFLSGNCSIKGAFKNYKKPYDVNELVCDVENCFELHSRYQLAK